MREECIDPWKGREGGREAGRKQIFSKLTRTTIVGTETEDIKRHRGRERVKKVNKGREN